MGDDVISGVIDTIDSANQHKLRLTELLSSLHEAKTQVHTSSAKSSAELKEHFGELKSQIISLLDSRYETLQAQISDIETRALVPLTQCEAVIEKDIAVASHILQQGKTLLGGDHENSQTAMIDYKAKANEMGLTSLPEVPPLSEVPCIYLETPEVLRQQLLTDVGDYGRIISRAPVQISSVAERPGSLVVKWAEVDDEDSQDLSEFCLQYKLTQQNADVPSTPHEVNVGAATCYTLRHINPMKSYTFQVKGRAEGNDATWSPWSVPYTAMTTIPHYEWRTNVEGYTLSRENKIGERLTTPPGEVLLYSQGSAYTCGQSVIFRVVELGGGPRPEVVESDRPALEEGIALAVSDEEGSLLRSGAIFVSADGSVFLDGQEKLTKLPALKRGSIVTFDTEVLASGKVRVTVEVDEKIVTFDWSIEKSKTSGGGSLLSAVSQSKSQEEINLFFAMRFSGQGWRIGVE